MAINKKLIHFKSKTNFEEQSSQGNILNTSICFIQDSKEISTHETIYSTVNWVVLDYPSVDLGLPSGTLWATYNVGAESPEEYGSYFAWGETEEKSEYTTNNSITYNKSNSELESQGVINADGNLNKEYDAATANWGGNWRMPTFNEMKELRNNCTWQWTSINGTNGYQVTGPNGNFIFLPAAGHRFDTSLIHAGYYGNYWSATPDSSSSDAYFLQFYQASRQSYYNKRYFAYTVRPVMIKNT